ncbi:MAG: CpXC domain-containing protein [Anaerolineae bacterium]|jgi:hypothetical protein|nr:CpXC domain-containing protein [Anaerolineae bacterium]
MQSTSTIRCSNCGQPIQARIVSFLDAQKEPALKAQLVNQQLNRVQCSACGTVNTVAVPLLYHDGGKELLVAMVPMELNVTKDQMERIIGDLMKMLPRENFKGYMFSPKRALTMQGLIEMVLQADGVTPDMINDAKARTQLVQQFVEASDEELAALIEEHDAIIDARFVQTFTSLAQRLAQSGRADMAQAVMATQQVVVERSSFGKELQAQQAHQQEVMAQVADELEGLGEDASQADFLRVAVSYAGDEAKIQALVGLIRPVLDDAFFALLDAEIAQTTDSAQREALDAMKGMMQELIVLVDQQAQARLGTALQFLQALVNAPNIEEMLQANAGMIDESFMTVLTGNLQEAERRRDIQLSARLKQVYEAVVAMINQTMPPEVQFLNQLLSVDNATALQLLGEGLKHFGPSLVELLARTADMVAEQGRADLSHRLRELHAVADQMANG